jgi:predicted nucleotidyltransferase
MDIKSLLRLLSENAVEFVVIGDAALCVHGHPGASMNIAVFIRPTAENAERVLKSLREFGYDVADLTTDDLLTKKVLIRQDSVGCDIHSQVAGTTFDRVWAQKVEAMYEDTPAFFASLDDLIEMKRAAGRPKDIEDLKVLLELKRRREEKGQT